jgi:probable rRNA maturation factor
MIILRKPVAGLNDKMLARFLGRVCRAAKLEGTVNVLVTGSGELRALNLRFLGKDTPTDVLSFSPMPGLVNGLAGDIAISAEIAAQNARLLGHSPAEEIKILALHGVLHLAGYDHEHDHGEMARKEASLRRSLGLPVGLMERNGQPPQSLNQSSKQRPPKKARAADKLALSELEGSVRPTPRAR